MLSIPMINEALGAHYTTALLLTGSAAGAEAAVLEGIRSMARDNVSDEALLQETISASISMNIPGERLEEREHAASLLPAELRRLLRLSQEFRRCFVLRMLVGLSREVCAQLLHTEINRVDELACASARALAFLPEAAS